MKLVSPEELISHKILPFNIYSEFGEKIFSAGEVLTPGKLLQLKHMNVLFRDDNEIIVEPIEESSQTESLSIQKLLEKVQNEAQNEPSNAQNEDFNQNLIIESFDMKPSKILRNKLSVDDIDISNYRGPVNKSSKIDPQTQLKIKAFYNTIIAANEEKQPLETLGLYANVRDKIVQDILSETGEIILSSQLKLLGEYNKCHALNTAILSGALAKKMELQENAIYDVVLAGLLHDIGKNKLPQYIQNKSSLTNQEQKIVQEHTKIGYKIIRIEMNLPENIARVALDHHEKNDGSGYPSGKSGDKINIESKIVSVCNYFDNLTSNRTEHKIKNTKEALKVMLQYGTQRFSADALYTFIHMFSYNDTKNFEEMVQ